MILNLHSSPSLSVFKYNSLLILGVNFTSCTLVLFASMSLYIHPSPLQHPPKEPPKINLKQNKQQNTHLTLLSFRNLLIHPSDVRSCGMSYSTPPSQISSTPKMFIAIGLVQGFFHTSSPDIIKIPLGYPAVSLSHGGPVLIIPQDQSLQELQHLIDAGRHNGGPTQGPGYRSGWQLRGLLSHTCGEGGAISSKCRKGGTLPWWAGPTLLLQCPAREG